MIRYGPAGIPLSCKGRTLKDGIEDVHNLCLTALEVQLVRPRSQIYPADEDEEVGQTLATLGPESGFIIGIEREGEFIYDRDVPISEEDNLIILQTPPALTFGDLAKLGKIARRHDVSLSSHAPYYMDLTANLEEDTEEAALTMEYMSILQQVGIITNELGGDVVVTSLGPYHNNVDREETDNNILCNVAMLMDMWHEYGLKPKLGIEITGTPDAFGSMEQIFDLCDAVEGVVPILNFAHHQARTGGSLMTANDFADIINQFADVSEGRIWSSFSNVEIDTDNFSEKYLTPLKKGDLKFEKLADALAELNPDMTIISSSPLLEHDAVYMRTLTERVLAKKAAKALKERQKAEGEELLQE